MYCRILHHIHQIENKMADYEKTYKRGKYFCNAAFLFALPFRTSRTFDCVLVLYVQGCSLRHTLLLPNYASWDARKVVGRTRARPRDALLICMAFPCNCILVSPWRVLVSKFCSSSAEFMGFDMKYIHERLEIIK